MTWDCDELPAPPDRVAARPAGGDPTGDPRDDSMFDFVTWKRGPHTYEIRNTRGYRVHYRYVDGPNVNIPRDEWHLAFDYKYDEFSLSNAFVAELIFGVKQ
jgi:hypothetical protein